ncbi:MAG: toll/interleukin-1 receptor domain-containing protein [Anaerolineales bacterium]|nr:toll/interleukin-1 receptor domain-containing protein [Anaerolineales bacterium]
MARNKKKAPSKPEIIPGSQSINDLITSWNPEDLKREQALQKTDGAIETWAEVSDPTKASKGTTSTEAPPTPIELAPPIEQPPPSNQPPNPQYTHDVFISYSHKNSKWIFGWLVPKLQEHGITVKTDRDFDVGAPIIRSITEATLRECRVTLLVVTSAWLASEWGNFENLLVLTRDPTSSRNRVIPLMREKVEMPDQLKPFIFEDFSHYTRWQRGLDRVVATIRKQAGGSDES